MRINKTYSLLDPITIKTSKAEKTKNNGKSTFRYLQRTTWHESNIGVDRKLIRKVYGREKLKKIL